MSEEEFREIEATDLAGESGKIEKDSQLECCPDWKPQTEKLNAPIVLAQARNPHLTATEGFQFKPWKFCPWCGRNVVMSKSSDFGDQ